MKYYELTYLISPELSEPEVKEIQEKLNSFIQDQGGILDSSNTPERTSLSYPVKKKNEAFLVSISFYLKPENIGNLEKEVKTKGSILRFLLFSKRKEKLEKATRRRPIKKSEKKTELKDIEEKLEEILG